FNNANKDIYGVSALFYDVYTDAMHYHKETGGLFNPLLGAEIVQLGYDKSFDSLSGDNQRENLRKAQGEAVIEPEQSSDSEPKLYLARLPQGVMLDFGGIAKGWTAQQARERICSSLENGFIDAGGDIIAWGTDPEGDPWHIGVADPIDNAGDIAEFSLKGEIGVATSSVVKRHWYDSKDMLQNHIIDPRTGLSADSDFIQATVLAPNLLEAEIFAKCLLILGSEQGPDWFGEIRPDLAFLAVDKNGILSTNTRLDHYCFNLEVNAYVRVFN
ncbi:MAG: FAD:protein FMN transferase, partial [Peptococcaceae bacterium]|nr:FAD:protein FMN transferase [Peptococcaceae bacterium]